MQADKPLPLLNSLFINKFGAFNPYGKDNTFKTFMTWARKSPQMMGFLNVIATDILSDDIKFQPVIQSSSGRNKVLKAKKFWSTNKGIDTAEETIYDMMINGIGYNWIGAISDTQVKEVCTKIATVYGDVEIKAERIIDSVSENRAKKLRFVPASTVIIEADEYEPIEYIQRVGANYRRFSPEEIIVFKLMPLDGKLYPFPPMEAILAEIYLLWLVTQCHLSFFQNGGSPDKVFILPKEIAGSKNHQYLIETLRKYKKVQNKHGNLVFTGELKIEDLMQVESQMENRELSLYLVGVLAMMYGIPAGRIPFLIGKAANNGDAGGLADSGYWRKISVWQSKIEEGYNNQLWIPFFGVEMRFGRAYKQDEVRETQIEMQKNDVVQQRLNLGLWTVEESGRYLGIDPEIVEAAQKEKEERDELEAEQFRQNESMSNGIQEPDKKTKNAKKQDTQNKHKTDSGGKTIKP